MFSFGASGAPAAGSRLALTAGFAVLPPLLVALAEFDGIAALRRIQDSTDAIRHHAKS